MAYQRHSMQEEQPLVKEGIANETEPLSTTQNPNVPPEKPEEEIVPFLDTQLEAQVTQLGRQTAIALKKQQQVETLIPLDPLNKKIDFVEACINGWNFTIKRNEWVKLPSSVVDLLANAGYNPSTRNYYPKYTKPFETPNLKITPGKE